MKMTSLNDTAHNFILKSIPNGDTLFSDTLGGLKESMRHSILYTIDLTRCTDITHNTTTSLLFSATVFEYLVAITSILLAKRSSFYIYNLYNWYLQNCTEIRLLQAKKCSQLPLVNYTDRERTLPDIGCASFRQFGITLVTEHVSQQLFSSQGDHCEPDELNKANKHNEEILQTIKTSNTAGVVATKYKDQALETQSAGYCVPRTLHTEKEIVEGKQTSQQTNNWLKSHILLQHSVTAKRPIANGIDQIILPSLHKLLIGNITTKPSGKAYDNPSGAHIAKELPVETELFPNVGPQHDALHNKNLEPEVQNSCEEIGQTVNKNDMFYQLEIQHVHNLEDIKKINFTGIVQGNDQLQVKVYGVNTEENVIMLIRSWTCEQYPLISTLTFLHPCMSEELDFLSFNKGSVSSNFCTQKIHSAVVEPFIFSNSLALSIKHIEKPSAYPTLKKLCLHSDQLQSRSKMLPNNLECVIATFNDGFKQPSKSSKLEEMVHDESLFKQLWLAYYLYQTELQECIVDEYIKKVLKLQGNNNAIFRFVSNKAKFAENNYETQRSVLFIHVKYFLPELQSFLKEVKSLAVLAGLPPMWCNAPNGGKDLVLTALDITCFNGIAYSYLMKSTANREQLFAEMLLGSLKESIGHMMQKMVVDLERSINLTTKATAYLSFIAGGVRPEYILNAERFQLSLYMNVFYFSYLYNHHLPPGFVTESKPAQWNKHSQLIVTNTCSKTIKIFQIVTGVDVIYHQLVNNACDIFRPFGKGITPATEPVDRQSFTNAITNQQAFASQEDHCVTDGVPKVNEYAEGNQQSVQQYNTTAISEAREQPTQMQQPHHMPVSSTNQLTSDGIQRDGRSPKHGEGIAKAYVPSERDVVEKDGKLSMASGIDQATPISSIPSEHKLMIGNVNTKHLDHNPSGAHIVKELPKQTELLPTVGPQLDALYNTNFDHEVQSSHEEVRQKAKARTTFYQHEVEQHAYNPNKMGEMNFPKNPPVNDKLQVKVPEVKAETGKAANDYKPKPLPKRSQIVCGSKHYPLVSNLLSHPHMDHYFVKERTEIRPSHYLAKLVLRHQYLNKYIL